MGSARGLDAVLGWVSSRVHPLAGEGLGEADAVPAGLTHVSVVQQPVNGRGGQGMGMSSSNQSGGVKVRADRDGEFLVGGIDQPIQAFGGVGQDVWSSEYGST